MRMISDQQDDSVEEKLAELYSIHDHFYTANKSDKQLKLKAVADEIVAMVDSSLLNPNDPPAKAKLYYIKGKALDVFSEYNETSENLLTKAVKLDPYNLEAWISLGNCFWKKGDLLLAKHSFATCLEYGSSKKALRHLSMVLRRIGNTPEEKSINIQTSVAKAKEAVKMDVNDGESWYVLGNAYLTLFFCNTHSPSDLDRAFSSYKRAESAGAENNPDLHYNRANVCRYREDYADAIKSYETAHTLDPSLQAQDAINTIGRWVSRVADLIHRKGRVKAKKLAALVTTLPDCQQMQGRKRVPVSSLRPGANEGKVVVLKLLVDVVRSNEPPGCFIMIDDKYTCIAVSIYHLDNQVYSKMSDKDVFFVLDPYLKPIDVVYNGIAVSYQCVQVAEPHLFLVNGKAMADSYAHAQVKLANFDL